MQRLLRGFLLSAPAIQNTLRRAKGENSRIEVEYGITDVEYDIINVNHLCFSCSLSSKVPARETEMFQNVSGAERYFTRWTVSRQFYSSWPCRIYRRMREILLRQRQL